MLARMFLISGLLLAMAPDALARISFATGVMGLTNSTKQGGQGSEGSTILTQTDFTYHGSWWGLGLFYQHDKQGSHETDNAYGPRLELTWNPFYLEYAYAMKLNRSFTDRSIAEQEGTAFQLGLGARFSLGASAGASGGAAGLQGGVAGPFLQFSYILRTQNVKKQDGEKLGEPVVQTDGYPLFGIGFGF